MVPGVGPSIEKDFFRIGVRCINDLKGKNPENLYRTLCKLNKANVDRCVLYVFRCAVYFADHTRHDPKLLKWWNWKDK